MNTKEQIDFFPQIPHSKSIFPKDDEFKPSSDMFHRRQLTSVDRERLKSGLVLASFCICSAVVLTVAFSALFYLSGVQIEMDALKQRLNKLEAKLNVVEENEISVTNKNEIFSGNRNRFLLAKTLNTRDGTVRSVSKEGLEVSTELGLSEDGIGFGRRRLRRSANQTKTTKTEKQRINTKPKSKELKSSNEKTSAVHFHPRNSSSRTITTKRGSPVLDFWEPAKWSKLQAKSFYHIRDGVVTILEDGVYFIYVQLVFHDLSGRWSFSININERQEMKCINSEHISSVSTFHPTNHGVYQHCFSSRLFHIRRLEQVTVRCLYEQRQILVSPEFTFWGIIKIS